MRKYNDFLDVNVNRGDVAGKKTVAIHEYLYDKITERSKNESMTRSKFLRSLIVLFLSTDIIDGSRRVKPAADFFLHLLYPLEEVNSFARNYPHRGKKHILTLPEYVIFDYMDEFKHKLARYSLNKRLFLSNADIINLVLYGYDCLHNRLDAKDCGFTKEILVEIANFFPLDSSLARKARALARKINLDSGDF